jgi:hypothetical protein
MNIALWEKILKFDFDNPSNEYGFSTRISFENYWTRDFTIQAILEYKKFMYLAATSDFMVSPSAIVDIVWHQHLIFTQSYSELCGLLGKQIQHIPSTHNKEDFQKFKLAKERTLKLYEQDFGKQPSVFWEYSDMFESLNLEKAKFKIRSFLVFGILITLALLLPFYFLLAPYYSQIENPNFIYSFALLALFTFIILEFYNKYQLNNITKSFDPNSFVFNLQPVELIFLETQKLSYVIHGTVNQLIDSEIIRINTNKSLELIKGGLTKNNEELQTTSVLKEMGTTFYPTLIKELGTKPLFTNTRNCMDALRKYINKSKKFSNLFYFNFGVFAVLFIFCINRIFTGVLREKPVVLISLVLILLTFLIILYLNRLTDLMCENIIPNLYKKNILPKRDMKNDWEWDFFLLGTAVFIPSFKSLVNKLETNVQNSMASSSCGTSYGSSCGSSCSSCGGCGGGD